LSHYASLSLQTVWHSNRQIDSVLVAQKWRSSQSSRPEITNATVCQSQEEAPNRNQTSSRVKPSHSLVSMPIAIRKAASDSGQSRLMFRALILLALCSGIVTQHVATQQESGQLTIFDIDEEEAEAQSKVSIVRTALLCISASDCS